MDYEEILMTKIAWYYYMENMTQQNISTLLGISRVRVIKLLEKARSCGIVQFKIRSVGERRMETETKLIEMYHLKDVFVVPNCTDNINETISKAAAMYIGDRVTPNCFINVGYGDTVSRTLNHLVSSNEVTINLVSLTGGVSYYLSGAASSMYTANLYLLPSPLIASSADMAVALKKEKSLKEIYRMTHLAEMTVVGIGGISDDATVIRSDILSKSDFVLLRMQNAVGDILCNFIDKNGNVIHNDVHKRLINTPLSELREFENVIGVAGGADKAEAIRAALNGNYLDVLITDEDTAQKLLETND